MWLFLDITSGSYVVLIQFLTLVLAVSCRLPPLARQVFPLFLGLYMWCCILMACSLTCLSGDGAALSFVDIVGSKFWFCRGFGSHDDYCMTVLCRTPLLARHTFPLCLGLVCGAVV